MHSVVRSGTAAPYDAYILHSDLEKADCKRLEETFPETERYLAQIYYRLVAPLLLPREPDRILYLDVDTVVINPLNKLCLGVQEDVPYVNTGGMLYNLTALRENVRLEEIRSFAGRKMQSFLLPDQDILMALYGEKVKRIDIMRHNLSDRILAFFNADPRNEKVDLDWVRKNGVGIPNFIYFKIPLFSMRYKPI